jgi:hypothetical protein
MSLATFRACQCSRGCATQSQSRPRSNASSIARRQSCAQRSPASRCVASIYSESSEAMCGCRCHFTRYAWLSAVTTKRLCLRGNFLARYTGGSIHAGCCVCVIPDNRRSGRAPAEPRTWQRHLPREQATEARAAVSASCSSTMSSPRAQHSARASARFAQRVTKSSAAWPWPTQTTRAHEARWPRRACEREFLAPAVAIAGIIGEAVPRSPVWSIPRKKHNFIGSVATLSPCPVASRHCALG